MNDPFVLLGIASGVFVATHFGISSTPLRPLLIGRLGVWPYRLVYSVIASAALAWMIYAYIQAPHQALWSAPRAVRLLPLVVMPFALVGMVMAYAKPPPTAWQYSERTGKSFQAVGVQRITRHPLMWSTGLWALAHMAASGRLAALLFFGGFAVLALVGTVLIDRRRAASMGKDWEGYAAQTSNLPLAAIVGGRNKMVWRELKWRHVALGLGLYAVFPLAHERLFGVTPW